MSRATDICTCGKDRDSHGTYDVEQHTFFPHPQPNTFVREQPDLREQTLAFLVLCGAVTRVTDNLALVQLPNGETWRFDISKVS